MSYRELAPPSGLRPLVACAWEQLPAHARAQRIVPDGCVDLIWLADRALVVAGADTAARVVALPAGRPSTGIRLRPGAAGAVLGLPASELCDRELDAEQVWGTAARRLADALRDATPGRRPGLLGGAVAARRAQPDALVHAAARDLSLPGARVATVAAQLGVTERTLHRRTRAAVGYGPKTLARVVRLRRLIAGGTCRPGANGGGDGLAGRAFAAGYASQAHMTEDVRRLTGLTPVRFLKDAALTAA